MCIYFYVASDSAFASLPNPKTAPAPTLHNHRSPSPPPPETAFFSASCVLCVFETRVLLLDPRCSIRGWPTKRFTEPLAFGMCGTPGADHGRVTLVAGQGDGPAWAWGWSASFGMRRRRGRRRGVKRRCGCYMLLLVGLSFFRS